MLASSGSTSRHRLVRGSPTLYGRRWRGQTARRTGGIPSTRIRSGPRPRHGATVERGELWLAEVGGKRRPVLVLTRSEVLDVRELVTVAEVTTSIRGLAVEVNVDPARVGLHRPSVINCDGLHTVVQSALTTRVGQVDDAVMHKVCSALSYALGC